MVDTTKSIKQKNIPPLKNALKQIVKQFDISEDGTHVSLETFAKSSTLHNSFNDSNYHNEQAVLDLIDSSIGKLTKPTRLDYAIQMANETLFTKKNGDRPEVQSVMVLFADGRSHPDTDVEQYVKDVKSIKVWQLSFS